MTDRNTPVQQDANCVNWKGHLPPSSLLPLDSPPGGWHCHPGLGRPVLPQTLSPERDHPSLSPSPSPSSISHLPSLFSPPGCGGALTSLSAPTLDPLQSVLLRAPGEFCKTTLTTFLLFINLSQPPTTRDEPGTHLWPQGPGPVASANHSCLVVFLSYSVWACSSQARPLHLSAPSMGLPQAPVIC